MDWLTNPPSLKLRRVKWGWWDSNLLSGKAPDLQSGPALRLRGTPKVHWFVFYFSDPITKTGDQKNIEQEKSKQSNRATGGTRTPDQLITNQLLYQLSYSGKNS